jgi:predicted amidophosphoribosyltransferase
MKHPFTITNFITHLNSWIRLHIWGCCPACNSDAPELYDCLICGADSNSPFDKNKKKQYWDKYKRQDD